MNVLAWTNSQENDFQMGQIFFFVVIFLFFPFFEGAKSRARLYESWNRKNGKKSSLKRTLNFLIVVRGFFSMTMGVRGFKEDLGREWMEDVMQENRRYRKKVDEISEESWNNKRIWMKSTHGKLFHLDSVFKLPKIASFSYKSEELRSN